MEIAKRIKAWVRLQPEPVDKKELLDAIDRMIKTADKKKFLVRVCGELSDFDDLECLLNEGYKITTHEAFAGGAGEAIAYTLELKEPEEAKIASVVSVDFADVDAKLKEGYEVHEIYAKNVVLTKRAEQTKISEGAKEVAELQGY